MLSSYVKLFNYKNVNNLCNVLLGEAIVTGAGDETLRFWNVFSKARSQKVCGLKTEEFCFKLMREDK